MKKISMNFVKIGLLLILGLGTLGAMSQVKADEIFRVYTLIEEETINLKVGESLHYNCEFETLKENEEITAKFNEAGIPLLVVNDENITTVEIQSKNKNVATVDEFGNIIAVANGEVETKCTIKVKYNGNTVSFYDTATLYVGNTTQESETKSSGIIMMIVKNILDLVKNILVPFLEQVAPNIMYVAEGLTSNL